MSMQEHIERDIKTAMLAGDKPKANALKAIKAALLNEAISKKLSRDSFSDEMVQPVLARESKKRQEAAQLYADAGESQRAEFELFEKKIIDAYLPEQMSETEVGALIKEETDKLDSPTMADMGKIIGAVKAKTGGAADGGLIAKLVKEKLSS